MDRRVRLLAPLLAGLAVSAATARSASPQAPPPTASPAAAAVSGSAAPAEPDPAAASRAAEITPAAEITQAPAAPAFPVEEYRLSNGLRVILAPDPTLPNVAVSVRYDVGSRDEPDGLSGIAHLVEHLMFERSRHVPEGALLRILSNAGASDLNGQTTLDGTYYYETVPPERLELALWVESDRMGFFLPALDERALAQERTVVLNELKTRVFDRPGGIGPHEVYGAAFPAWHPYHGTAGGEDGDLRRITLADVRAFAATWYGPANATLVLAGRFERDGAAALVKRYFETLSGRVPPERPGLPALVHRGETRVDIAADVGMEELWLAWVTPALGAPGDAALDRVAAVLGRGDASRLQQRIAGAGLAKAVEVIQASHTLAGLFVIRALAEHGVPAEDLIAAIDREILDLATFGPTRREMMRVQSYWETGDMFGLETALGRAERLHEAARLGRIQAPFDWSRQATRALGAADVRAATAAHLAPRSRAAVVITRFQVGATTGGTVVRREEP